MMKSKFIVPFLLLTSLNLIAQNRPDTNAKRPIIKTSTYKLKTGAHNISIQWIGWDKPGKAMITDLKNGTYKIEGEQKNPVNSDYLKISGIITPLSIKELSFNGTIISKIEIINKGAECKKEGLNTFKAKRNKKYWRLVNNINCEGGTVTDYIDIYF